VLPIILLALQVSGGEKAGWRLMGYLALWMYASPLVGLVGVVLTLVNKVPAGADHAARSKTRTVSIIVHVLLLVLSAGFLWNASR
jgi:hypothetical protein